MGGWGDSLANEAAGLGVADKHSGGGVCWRPIGAVLSLMHARMHLVQRLLHVITMTLHKLSGPGSMLLACRYGRMLAAFANVHAHLESSKNLLMKAPRTY